MIEKIPYGRQNISKEDIQAVVEVLHSDFLTQGPIVPAFEEAIASHCGVDYAVAMNSATSALHLACLALNVKQGDFVWTSPISFVASANCAIYCGASIDFVDIDPYTYNISVHNLADKLAAAKIAGKLPKVIIPVHLSGQSCDMEGIYNLSKKYGFRIIEDASHAIGGRYKNKPIGSCEFSDICVFSFHPVKIITTGERGVAVTNNEILAERIRTLRSHGISTNVSSKIKNNSTEIWNYQQNELGFNYRMTDIQAALGLSQMKKLSDFIVKRKDIADCYDKLLSSLPILCPWRHPDCNSSFHLYIIRLNLNKISKSQREIFEFLREAEIFVNLHYIPIYLHPFYENKGFKRGYCFEAERYFSEVLSIPIYPSLREDQQYRIVNTIKEIIG